MSKNAQEITEQAVAALEILELEGKILRVAKQVVKYQKLTGMETGMSDKLLAQTILKITLENICFEMEPRTKSGKTRINRLRSIIS